MFPSAQVSPVFILLPQLHCQPSIQKPDLPTTSTLPSPSVSDEHHGTGQNPGAWVPGQQWPVGHDEASQREHIRGPILRLLHVPASLQAHR